MRTAEADQGETSCDVGCSESRCIELRDEVFEGLADLQQPEDAVSSERRRPAFRPKSVLNRVAVAAGNRRLCSRFLRTIRPAVGRSAAMDTALVRSESLNAEEGSLNKGRRGAAPR